MTIYKSKKPSKQTKAFVRAWAQALAVAYIKKETQCLVKQMQKNTKS